MEAYDPILAGPLNLYNVTLAILLAIAIAIAIRRLVVASRAGWQLPRGRRLVATTLAVALCAFPAVGFASLVAMDTSEDLPTWGVFYLLPAAFLVATGLLGIVRPRRAGLLLLASALVFVLHEAVLGAISGTIDPRWAADEVALGGVAAAIFWYAVPATVTALVFLVAGASAGSRGIDPGPAAPHRTPSTA